MLPTSVSRVGQKKTCASVGGNLCPLDWYELQKRNDFILAIRVIMVEATYSLSSWKKLDEALGKPYRANPLIPTILVRATEARRRLVGQTKRTIHYYKPTFNPGIAEQSVLAPD